MSAAQPASGVAPALEVTMAGVRFPTPVLAAAGSLGFGREVREVVDLRAYGGFVTKSVTLEPRRGHPRPDLVEVAGGWLNALGLPNPGVAGFIHRDLPFLRTLGIPIIVSVAGQTVEEFGQIVEVLEGEDGVAAVELNVSCPNVRAGRLFGSEPALAAELVAAVRPLTRRPLFVKLGPLAADIAAVGRAAADAGADALCCLNTLPGLAIDVERRRPLLGAGPGGLSGPPLRPLAVWSVWRVARATALPVVGVGGVRTWEDAVEFLLAGATAVALASAAVHPQVPQRITTGLRDYMRRHGLSHIGALVGRVEGLEEEEGDGP
ncbi:MAG: dihydroorotate dehydrogenase [Armatimonadota bacterium]|nr:dihydroorotate dehydrogenase [Armatimonadota bacterium]MDR7427460.1 dihydroorotate dehydrogenase [Armatimonadota bacterium]MDR7469980.1 dihydroorotate dehydrogenase [Armatimonadota bacterium]